MLFISKSFTFFSVSWDHVTVIAITLLLYLVTCMTVICDIILYPLSESKERKNQKIKEKKKIKRKRKEKENK